MRREDFKKLANEQILILDGATGTNLQKPGLPSGVCPEKWILENPDKLISLQKEYVEAGSMFLYAPTFGCNRIKLAEYGLEKKIVEMNNGLVALSRKAACDKAYVCGDMTMTGKQLIPTGTMEFEELVDIYKEQADILIKAGVDLFAVETMMSLNETRAAIIAIRELCDLPIMATLTFESDGRTLFGTPPEVVPGVLEGLGADAVGINCGLGPETMTGLIDTMYMYSNIPVIAKPNNGLPKLQDGKTVYDMTPEEFVHGAKDLLLTGARIIGGCCGTTPEHIRILKEMIKDVDPMPVRNEKRRVFSSERKIAEIFPDEKFTVIGERINPTGKKALQEQLRAGNLDMVRKMAESQEENGAEILDINMGTNGIDEKEMMLKAVNEVGMVSDCPLCIDSSFPDVIEAALRIYPGRALINSISCEKEKFDTLLPIAKKYGAGFILLPLTDEGIPETTEKKHDILHNALKKIYEAGFSKEDIIVDALAATVGADSGAALSCLETFSHCKNDLGLASVCGLSNISFGLPGRGFVNSSFLALAIANGLTMAIANPEQDLLMNTAFATDLLLNRQGSDIRYINRINYYEEHADDSAPVTVSPKPKTAPVVKKEDLHPIFKAVLDGDKENIISLTQKALDNGEAPGDILNNYLISAINKVGELFEKKVYFLPQLIASANAMETAIGYLEPMLKKGVGDEKAVIVIATVEGDVHDIGKNLVALMLKNYGYKVIDLGKDVPAETIIDTAIKEKADIIGLSALMTTTMIRMKDVIDLAGKRGCTAKIIIGGAAITDSYAKEIGADGYSKDAADCVKLVSELLS